MSAIGVLRIAISLAVVFLLVKPLGAYMARVYEGRRTLLDPRPAAPGAPPVPALPHRPQ